jgi:ribosomal protein L29
MLIAQCRPGGDLEFLVIRSKNDLLKQLQELKQELLTLRVQKIAGGSAAKLTKMWVVYSEGSGILGLCDSGHTARLFASRSQGF